MANISVSNSVRFKSGELFADYDLHKVAQLSTSSEEMVAVILHYCASL